MAELVFIAFDARFYTFSHATSSRTIGDFGHINSLMDFSALEHLDLNGCGTKKDILFTFFKGN